ncbi:CfrBI family restriction endonuclease [bacterium]|nr:CfrBI family restriction endonuclease [bacterium]
MTLESAVVQKIIRRLIRGEDYRIEIISLLDAQFLQYAIDFFKRVVNAKLNDEIVTIDWYKNEFLNPNLETKEIAINSGLNMKTISNMYNTARRNVVVHASIEHFDTLYDTLNELIDNDDDLEITLTVKFKGVSVELNVSESLIVINTIAVKRSALRGGLWSTAGKQVEKPLIKTLCMLFNVPKKHYDQSNIPESLREVDFYLIGKNPEERYRSEVKLMGKGNPEGADVIHARDTRVFVADKLSETNITQFEANNVEWVEMRTEDGYKRFLVVLKNLGIPGKDFKGDIDKRLTAIFREIF